MLQVTLDFRLELPQVAVIGSQSSGKSSVLEALVSSYGLAGSVHSLMQMGCTTRLACNLRLAGISCQGALKSAPDGLLSFNL